MASELDNSIEAVERDIKHYDSRPQKSKSDQPTRKRALVPVLVICGIIVAYQVNLVTQWVFGVPDEKVQADVQQLLRNTDAHVQAVYGSSNYPDTLPADTPDWLINYKKTLSGYKLASSIDDVSIELERVGTEVRLKRLPD